MDETKRARRERGYVETMFGRRIVLPRSRGGNGPRRAGAEAPGHQRTDAGHGGRPDQLAMIAVQQTLDDERRGRMIMQVHDELVFEVPRPNWPGRATPCAHIMAGVATLKVPLLAEGGRGQGTGKSAH